MDSKNYRYLISQLVKRDFHSRFSGSYLGIFWAFLQPLSMMLVLWMVFTKGLKSSPSGETVPFVAWFFPAMIMWNFFQDALLSSTHAISEYSFLVKKVAFESELLPLVKILSSLLIHFIFILIVLVLFIVMNISINLDIVMLIYFLISSIVLLLSLSWMTASLNVFSKDISQLVGVGMQFGFWLTPILWNADRIPDDWKFLLWFHPIFYLTEGYRNSFLGNIEWNQNFLISSLIFWGICIVFWTISRKVFSKLKIHFGDVL